MTTATKDPPTDEAEAGTDGVLTTAGFSRVVSPGELELSEDVLSRLRDRAGDMTPEAVVDDLMKVVDVHPTLKMPDVWPGTSEEIYRAAPYLAAIGRVLVRGCRGKIEIPQRDIMFVWRRKKKWQRQGVDVRCHARSLNDLSTYLTEGQTCAVVGNYEHFRFLNTRQRVAAIYHALRSFDTKGKLKPPQFEGWYDELSLFGAGTNEQTANLARAVEHGAKRSLPYEAQATLFGNDDDDEGDDGTFDG